MRTSGNILNVPGECAREKKVSTFKTISFLVSSPENESACTFSNHAHDNQHDDETIPDTRYPDDDTTIPDLYPSAGDKTFPSLFPPGKSCEDIPPTKNHTADYPGRFVLYSGHFHPLNQTLSTDYNKNQSGEP
jgi:hypothetical protein